MSTRCRSHIAVAAFAGIVMLAGCSSEPECPDGWTDIVPGQPAASGVALSCAQFGIEFDGVRYRPRDCVVLARRIGTVVGHNHHGDYRAVLGEPTSLALVDESGTLYAASGSGAGTRLCGRGRSA